MATLAVAAGAAAIGGWIGAGVGAVGMGISLGWTIGAYAGQMLFGEDRGVDGPRLEDLTVESSAYGEPIYKVYGSVRLAGNIIWADEITEYEHEEGGKGGGGGYSTYTYTCSFAVALCEGEIAGIRRMWANGDLIFDNTENATYATLIESTSSVGPVTVYTGSETQEPDPVIEAIEGENNVPSYKGIAYVVFECFNLTDYGGNIPNLEFEIAKSFTTTDISISLPTSGGDVYTWGSYFYWKGYIWDENWEQVKSVSLPVGTDGPSPTNFYAVAKDGDNFYLVNCWKGDIVYMVEDAFLDLPYNVKSMCAFTHPNSSVSFLLIMGDDLKGHLYKYTPIGLFYYTSLDFGEKGYYTSAYYVSVRVKDNVIVTWSWDKYWGSGVTHQKNALDIWDWDITTNQVTKRAFDPNLHKWETSTRMSGFDFYDPYNTGSYDIVICTYAFNPVTSLSLKEGISFSTKQMYVSSDSATDKVGLDAIVSDIFERCGLSATEYDVTDLASYEVIGYALTSVMSGVNAIEPLKTLFQFDVIEADNTLKAVARGGNSIGAIADDDLAAHEYGSDQPDRLVSKRQQETELPREIDFEYQDYDTDYQVNNQTARRIVTSSNHVEVLRIPVVMQSSEALQRAEILLQSLWASRDTYTFYTTAKWFKLTPADVLSVRGTLCRITEGSLKFPNLLEFQAVTEETPNVNNLAIAAAGAAYSDPIIIDSQTGTASTTDPSVALTSDSTSSASYSSDSEVSSPPSTPQIVETKPTTFTVFLNIPSIGGLGFNSPGFYVACYGLKSSWGAATIYRSMDDGYTWDSVGSTVGMCTVGILQDVLGSGKVNVWDRANSVTVSIDSYGKSLSSVTEINALTGSNTAAIGVDGRWEIISFTDVIDNGDGTYTISNFIRGRKGTEHNADNHEASDTFVLIDSNLVWIEIASENIDSSYIYKAVTSKSTLQQTSIEETFACTGTTLEPYSPVHIKAERKGNGDVIITWQRRSRIEGSWGSGDISLAEDSEEYEVDILDETTVVRTLNATADDVGITYTSVQQLTDFGSAQASLDIIVYQKSATVGRGSPRLLEGIEIVNRTVDVPNLPGGTRIFTIGDADSYWTFMSSTMPSWDVNLISPEYSIPADPDRHWAPGGLFLSPSGHRFYYACREGIREYSLSTPFDLSTISHLHTKSPHWNSMTRNVFFKEDGTIMYEVGYPAQVAMGGQPIFQFSLFSAWDLSTASYDDKKSFDMLIDAQMRLEGLSVVYQTFLKPDGLKLFVCYGREPLLYEYNLGVAWDITTLSYVQRLPHDAPNVDNNIFWEESVYWGDFPVAIRGVFITSDGKNMYIGGNLGGPIGYYFSLENAWDLSSAEGPQYFTINTSDPHDLEFHIGGN